MSPFEHGEVFVLDDGGEADLDLGNYERFLDLTLKKDNNITTGKIYQVRLSSQSPESFPPIARRARVATASPEKDSSGTGGGALQAHRNLRRSSTPNVCSAPFLTTPVLNPGPCTRKPDT